MTRSEARRARRVRTWRLLAGTVVLLGVVGALTAASGHYQTVSQASLRTRSGRRGAPAWTRPCWYRPTYGRVSCARVSGRVVWIQRKDPDGDGDRHFVLLAQFRLRIVKVRRGSPVPTPGLGSRFRAVGVTKTGGSGRTEIELLGQ